MKEPRTRRSLALVVSALALSLVLSGCGMLSSMLGGAGDAERDESGQVTDNANIGVFSLKVGDCKMDSGSGSGQISDVDVVPCSQPHDEEVFFEYRMPDGEFSSDAVDTASQEQCTGEAFTRFVGMSWQESVLEVYPITPTPQTWEQLNNRVILCVVFDPSGPTTGSLAGAAR